MKISIIGSGFVGTALGKGLTEMGHNVLYYDVVDKDLPNFTKNINIAIRMSDVSFICVPTPQREDGGIDLSYIKDVSKKIGVALADKQDYHVVVVKSTVVPGTTEVVVAPILMEHSRKKAGEDFGLCMNPEFLTEISGSWSKDTKRDFFSEDRIVIGEYDVKSGDVLKKLYKPLGISIFRVSPRVAEVIKYASNCMLATKISYWNDMFLTCKKLGINSQQVADILAADPRIGKYGSVHGKAYGGTCLPKDLKAFLHFSRSKLLKAVDDINEEMKEEYGVRE